MQREKAEGGLGMRCFESFNVAMLMRQLWTILKNPQLLVSQVMNMKYFKNSDMFSSEPKSNDSFVWKSLRGAMKIFKSGLKLEITNGSGYIQTRGSIQLNQNTFRRGDGN